MFLFVFEVCFQFCVWLIFYLFLSGKDIEIALTEIQELQQKLDNLSTQNVNFKDKISFLETENKKLNR